MGAPRAVTNTLAVGCPNTGLIRAAGTMGVRFRHMGHLRFRAMNSLLTNPAVERDAFRVALRSTHCAPHCER